MSTTHNDSSPAETANAVPAVPVWAPSDWPAEPARAAPSRRVCYAPMTEADLDGVAEVEKSAYAHPWSRKHFADSMGSGYPAMLLLGELLPGELAWPPRADGRVLLGYLVAMPGVEEVHLLNITVSPAHQRQGWARCLLDALVLWSRGHRALWLWLEARESNTPARALYTSYGFADMGVRKAYYPVGQGRREDAIVMNLSLQLSGAGEDTV
ncbi:ribosomal-protein-alanine N-acetyltransferase [Hydrogenophaga sp. PAMC20947]|nr:ribosomal-protein-alanine N-acetyltransferase [Hydrogenophaga sp. PAMC20947]